MNWTPLRRLIRYYYLKTVKEKGSPDYIARGWAIGMAVNWIVPVGVQTLFSLPLAFVLKGSKLGSVLGTMLTNPATIVFFYPFQCYLGNLVLGGDLSFAFFKEKLQTVIAEQTLASVWELSGSVLVSYFAGGLLLLVVTTPLCYFIVRALVVRYRALRAKRLLAKIRRQRGETLLCIPDRQLPIYQLDEKINFIFTSAAETSLAIRYQIREWDIPVAEGEAVLAADGRLAVDARLDHPGFLLCEVEGELDGERLFSRCGAAVAPGRIRPVLSEARDFDRFWQEGLERQRQMPPVRLEKIAEYSSGEYTSYRVIVPAIDGQELHGFLTVPAGPGPFPAVATVPGAGPGCCRPDVSMAADGVILLLMNVHPFRPALDDDEALQAQYLACYGEEQHYLRQNTADPERYLYRRSHLAVSRAIDFVAALPEFDGAHFVASGASQGGTYAVAMAALNRNITAAAAMVPGFGDLGAPLTGRGRSHILFPARECPAEREAMLRTAGYYDSAFFARRIRVPVIFSAGFLDDTCTPASVYAIYNEIITLKDMIDMPSAGHRPSPEANEKRDRWVRKRLELR